MMDNPYLDTIISLVLIYAVLSVLVSMAVEWLNDWLRERGLFLKANIERMVNDPFNLPFGRMLYRHPMIGRLQRTASRLPAYIAAQSFATAFMDTVAGLAPAASVGLAARLRASVSAWKPSPLRDFLQSTMDRCTDAVTGNLDLDKVRTELMQWYNEHMDRATGAYKDKQRWKLYIVGFSIALFLNVDTIHLAHTIFLDEPLRRELVAKAERASDAYTKLPDSLKHDVPTLRLLIQQLKQDTVITLAHLSASAPADSSRQAALPAPTETLTKRPSNNDRILQGLVHALALQQNAQRLDSARAALERWGLPIGWARDQAPCIWFADSATIRTDSLLTSADPLLAYYAKRNSADGFNPHMLLYVIGICLTGLAISLGAPFWFETLVKLINIRRAGVKPTNPNAN